MRRTVLHKAQELDFRLTMDYRRMGGVVWITVCVCVCVFVCWRGVCLLLKWFEESCKQQVGEASSPPFFSPSCSLFANENIVPWKECMNLNEHICHIVCLGFLLWIFIRTPLIRECKIKPVIINIPFLDLFFCLLKLNLFPHCSTKSCFGQTCKTNKLKKAEKHLISYKWVHACYP